MTMPISGTSIANTRVATNQAVAIMYLLISSFLSQSSSRKISLTIVERASLPQNKRIGYVVYVLAAIAIRAINTVGLFAE